MYVYVGNLPGGATLVDLQRFLGDHAMSVDFTAHRHPLDPDQHFVLIRAFGDAEAGQLVRELDGRLFEGVPVQARRWITRARTSDWEGPERRCKQLDLDLIFSS